MADASIIQEVLQSIEELEFEVEALPPQEIKRICEAAAKGTPLEYISPEDALHVSLGDVASLLGSIASFIAIGLDLRRPKPQKGPETDQEIEAQKLGQAIDETGFTSEISIKLKISICKNIIKNH